MNIKEKFEIYIYTAATRVYAEEIINYLNNHLKLCILSKERLVSREDILKSNNDIEKSIKSILPSDTSLVIIVDDRKDVWKANDIINITPFYFFNEFARNKKEKFFLQHDFALYSVSKILVFIHQCFFTYYNENNKKVLDVHKILNEKFKLILNYNFQLSSTSGLIILFPLGVIVRLF